MIGLIGTRDARSAALAARVAADLGRERRHVILVSLETEEPLLDRHLGVGDSPGLAAVLSGERRLIDVALPSRGRGFIYVPAGQSGDQTAQLLASPALASLARQVRERGGLLLLYIPDRSLVGAARARGLVDLVFRLDERSEPPDDGAGGKTTAGLSVPGRAVPPERRRRWRGKKSGRTRGRWRAGLGVVFLLITSALLAWAASEWVADGSFLDLLQPLLPNAQSPP